MIRLNDNICIIPARGGSKRIKKNIKKFFDHIISYVIKSLENKVIQRDNCIFR